MKKILIAIAVLFSGLRVSAQTTALSVDEHNKYVYYEVVEAPGLNADSLHKRAQYFMNVTPGIKPEKEPAENELAGKGKFITYVGLSMLKHEEGEVNYTLHIEFKDQKYRYWLTDFTYTPYTRDRYNNYVPVSGVSYPFEKAQGKISKKEFSDCTTQTADFCRQTGEQLKEKMKNISKLKEKKPPVKIVTDKW